MLKGSVEIIDSREGVAQQAFRILEEAHLFRESTNGTSNNTRSGTGTNRLFVSGNGLSFSENERYQRFSKMFGLEWSGRL